MKQFQLRENKLQLNVADSPALLRYGLFASAGLLFAVQFVIVFLKASEGRVSFLSIGFFSLTGFLVLKEGLWKTYGREYIEIWGGMLIYERDYKWFRKGRKEVFFDKIDFGKVENSDGGFLIIEAGGVTITSKIKMPTARIEEIISGLRTLSL